MYKRIKYILAMSIILLLTLSFIGCGNNSKDLNASLEKFTNELKAKNYNFKVKDVEKDFLSGNRKRIIIRNEAIDVYLYKNNSEMEEDADKIDSGGCSYTNGTKSLKVSWSSYPHFYKIDNIIVQYVGEDKNMISDLKDIFREQFAGYK